MIIELFFNSHQFLLFSLLWLLHGVVVSTLVCDFGRLRFISPPRHCWATANEPQLNLKSTHLSGKICEFNRERKVKYIKYYEKYTHKKSF